VAGSVTQIDLNFNVRILARGETPDFFQPACFRDGVLQATAFAFCDVAQETEGFKKVRFARRVRPNEENPVSKLDIHAAEIPPIRQNKFGDNHVFLSANCALVVLVVVPFNRLFLCRCFGSLRHADWPEAIVSTHSAALLSDEGIGLEEVLLLIPHSEGTDVRPANSFAEAKALVEGGMKVGEAVLPLTSPQQMYLIEP
jgi:hypothetical protein